MATFLYKGERVEARDRCEIDGAKLRPCLPLEDLAGWFSDNARTCVRLTSYRRDDDSARRDAVTVHHGLKFQAFRHCPFCGVAISTKYPPRVLDTTTDGAP